MSIAILMVVLPALLAAAAVSDLTTYRIPNIIPGAMILLFVTFLIAVTLDGHVMSWREIGFACACGLHRSACRDGNVRCRLGRRAATLSFLPRFCSGWVGTRCSITNRGLDHGRRADAGAPRDSASAVADLSGEAAMVRTSVGSQSWRALWSSAGAGRAGVLPYTHVFQIASAIEFFGVVLDSQIHRFFRFALIKF